MLPLKHTIKEKYITLSKGFSPPLLDKIKDILIFINFCLLRIHKLLYFDYSSRRN